MIELWKNINYKTPMKYFVNTYIKEYDLSKANINALLYTNRISLEDYNIYFNMDKALREKEIGLLIKKDKTLYKDIQKGIIEAKKQFILSNNLNESDIVSIKNDAVFVLSSSSLYTDFPPFTFNCKNTYTVFLQLKDLEVYYGDTINPNDGTVDTIIDIKGISDKSLLLHQNGMFDLICDLCYKLQREHIKDTMYWISELYRLFITRSLPKQYYRNFDSLSKYTIDLLVNKVGLDEITDDMVSIVNINRNLSIFRELVGIVSDIYRRKMR